MGLSYNCNIQGHIPKTEATCCGGPGSCRGGLPEELSQLLSCGLEGDVPDQDLGAGLLFGHLLLLRAWWDRPGGGQGKGSQHGQASGGGEVWRLAGGMSLPGLRGA